MFVGWKIKELRTKKGISRKTLCEKVSGELPLRTLEGWENGRPMTSLYYANEIAKVLGCSLQDIWEGEHKLCLTQKELDEYMKNNDGK